MRVDSTFYEVGHATSLIGRSITLAHSVSSMMAIAQTCFIWVDVVVRMRSCRMSIWVLIANAQRPRSSMVATCLSWPLLLMWVIPSNLSVWCPE